MDGEGFNFFHFKLMWCARCIFHASASKANRTEHNCKCPYGALKPPRVQAKRTVTLAHPVHALARILYKRLKHAWQRH